MPRLFILVLITIIFITTILACESIGGSVSDGDDSREPTVATEGGSNGGSSSGGSIRVVRATPNAEKIVAAEIEAVGLPLNIGSSRRNPAPAAILKCGGPEELYLAITDAVYGPNSLGEKLNRLSQDLDSPGRGRQVSVGFSSNSKKVFWRASYHHTYRQEGQPPNPQWVRKAQGELHDNCTLEITEESPWK